MGPKEFPVAEFPGILLIVALVVISGIIAYVGDVVGRRMGRKRLTVFGLRPRHTAIAISVIAGMLITIVTLAVAMAVSRDVKDGFLRVAEMRRRQAELSRQIRELNDRMAGLDQTRKAAEKEVERRRAELDDTRRTLEDAHAELEHTQRELENASAALDRGEEAFKRLALSEANLARKKDELQRDIEKLRVQAAGGIALERMTPVLFVAGQPLDWKLIAGGRPTKEIRKDLASFVQRLDRQARAAGASPLPDSDSAVVIRKPVRDPDGESVSWFNADQVLDAVAERIHESVGGVIVRAFCVFNTHPGEPVRVDFELFRNHLVFRKGDSLAQTSLDGRLSEPALTAAVVALLRDEVGDKAREQNVMPRPSPSGSEVFGSPRGAVGQMSYDEIFAVVERLRQIGGPARVTAVAATNTWTIGPLEVDLLVSPL